MANPVLESWNVVGGTGAASSSITANAPTGISDGDVWVVICADDADGDTNNWDAAPAGWQLSSHMGDADTDCHMQVYTKRCDGTETTQEFTHNGVSDELWNASFRVSHVDQFSVAAVTGKVTSMPYNTDTISLDAFVTSLRYGLLGLFALAFDGGDGAPFTITSTNNHTKLADITNVTG